MKATPTATRLVILAAVVGGVAAALRLWTLAESEAANPLFHVLVLDEAVYVREANRFAEGQEPTRSLVSLLWPWLLARIGALSRHAASLVNVGIGSAVAALAAVGAARLAGSLVAGIVAGGVCAVSGALVFQDVTAQTEPLLALAALGSALCLAAAAQKPTWGRLALAGVVTGVAVLGRGTNAALLLGALPALRGVEGVPRKLRIVAVLAGALLPVLVFHTAVGAVPTSAGVNVWLGNNAFSRAHMTLGTDEFVLNPDIQAKEIYRIAEAAEGRPLRKAEMNRWWMRRALREMGDAPGAAALHFVRKAAFVFYAPDLGGNHDVEAERMFAAWLRIAPVSAAWILVLGGAGLVAAWRVPGIPAAGLALIGALGALVVVFPLTRYVMPLVPIAAVLAGVGVAALLEHRRWKAPAATLVALTGVSLLAGTFRAPTRPDEWMSLAIASAQSHVGDPETFARRAIQDDPLHPAASAFLGTILVNRGRPAEALALCDRAVVAAQQQGAWTPAIVQALMCRSHALISLGRAGEAFETYDAARRRYPTDADLAAEGVFLEIRVGNRPGAARRLAEARALAPSHPRVIEAGRELGH